MGLKKFISGFEWMIRETKGENCMWCNRCNTCNVIRKKNGQFAGFVT